MELQTIPRVRNPFRSRYMLAHVALASLMKEIKDYLISNPLPADLKATVESVTVYETSAVGTLSQFAQLLSEVGLHQKKPTDGQHIFLHFGVSESQGNLFKLERTAWNGSAPPSHLLFAHLVFMYSEASFRVPDERGWTPTQQAIIQANGSIAHCFKYAQPGPGDFAAKQAL